MSLSASFNNLQPKHKRTVMAVAAIAMVLGISWVLASMTERKASKVPRAEKPEVTVVSPARTSGVEAFSAKLQLLEKGQQETEIRLARALKEGELKRQKAGEAGGADDLPNLDEPAIPPLAATTSVFDAPTAKPAALPPPPATAHSNPPGLGAPSQQATPSTAESSTGAAAPAAPTRTIRVIGESGELGAPQVEEKLNKPEVKPRPAKANESAFIPSGSMFTGVLLNGLDAPTSAVAQKNPTPVVIRVKREALLPNFASIDVRECFLLAAGYGQLSSERALMRAESLSCVRTDGQVIESKVDAFIVGSDGKVGVPGRLVSKQGQMIAQSLLAGALGGIGQSLTKSRVPSLNINPGMGDNIYQEESLSSIGQSGLAGGVASSTNMIAKFYLDMAKETFPVVEIPAGEVATVVVTRGASLPLKGSTSLQKFVDPNERQRGPQPARPAPEEHVESRTENDASASVLGMAQQSASAIATGAAQAQKPSFKNGLGW